MTDVSIDRQAWRTLAITSAAVCMVSLVLLVGEFLVFWLRYPRAVTVNPRSDLGTP